MLPVSNSSQAVLDGVSARGKKDAGRGVGRLPGKGNCQAEGAGDPRPRSSRGSGQRIRIVDAALVCVGAQGLGSTTVDDVARQAGVSRATVYRLFPGGKDELVGALVETEVARFLSSVATAMGEKDDLEDAVVAGMLEATRRLRAHAVLNRLLAEEPEVVLPHIAFGRLDRVLVVVGELVSPFLQRFLDHETAARIGEWAARIVMAYVASPSAWVDLGDPGSARRLVRTFVLPGVEALRIPMPGVSDREQLPGHQVAPGEPTANGADPKSRLTEVRAPYKLPAH